MTFEMGLNITAKALYCVCGGDANWLDAGTGESKVLINSILSIGRALPIINCWCEVNDNGRVMLLLRVLTYKTHKTYRKNFELCI